MISKGDKKLFLIDAYALIYRAYFAFAKNPRITSKGVDTSAIYGFTNMLWDLINTENPNYLGVVFDTPQKTHRHIEYTDYKANRDAMPEGISTAIPYIKNILDAFNIPIIYLEGFEADDIIGTLAKQADKEGFQTYMITPDKDFAQLVSRTTFMFRPGTRGNPNEIWDTNKVCEKFEINEVNQVIDFLGMVGDAVDNIPGIRGVGPKTASKLIQKYGSIESLYDSINELEGKLKQKVYDGKQDAFLSKKLATIVVDAPIKLASVSLKYDTPNLKELKEIFDELEFTRIYDRISKHHTYNAKNTSLDSEQLNLFTVDKKSTEEIMERGKEISKISDLKNIVSELLLEPSISFFVFYENEIPLGISMLDSNSVVNYIFFSETSKIDDVLRVLQPLFISESIEKILFNAKSFFQLLLDYQIKFHPNFFDINIAEYLLNPDLSRTFSTLIQKYNISIINIDLLDINISINRAAYLIGSAIILREIKTKSLSLLKQNNLLELFYNVETPLVMVLLKMEINGIKIDINLLKQYSDTLTNEILVLESNIYNLSKEQFNIGSPKQLGEILFNKMCLSKNPKKTKSGQFSTSESELIKLKDKHPIIDSILLFRTYQKLLSTYVNALPVLISPHDNKVHTTFNQTVANTGRLSSSNPNLQNIPIRKQSGKDVRKAFVASDTQHTLMSADYSQIELRLIAELSNETNMIEAFLNNEDIHVSTASKVFNVDVDDVNNEMRSNAKTINFGIIYGVSAFGLSEQSTLNRKEASILIEKYFEKYPRLKTFIESQIQFAQKHGYVKTILGRKRYLRNINSRNSFIRGHDERNAVNMPIQGSAADIIKLAMIKIQKELDKRKLVSKMVLQVHDELVFDVFNPEKAIIQEMVKEIMENIYKTEVPLKVDVGFGTNWLQAH